MVEITARLVTFHVLFWGVHFALFAYGFMKQKNDPELAVLNSIGPSVTISRGAGLVLGVDCAALLIPVCRNIVRFFRSSFLNRYVPIDENLYFHKWLAYSMLFFTLIHANAHYTNFFFVETKLPSLNLKAWMVHYLAWGGVTGHIMLIIMFFMYTSAKLEVKTKNFEYFWYTHHLFVPFYFCLFFHSFGCFVKSSTTGKCKGYNSNYGTIPIFVVYIAERLLREYRARLPTVLSKVIFHPGNTMELRIEKPEQPVCLDVTKKGITKNDRIPEIRVDGPYGAPAEDLYNYKIALLVGAGIGVTPAASLLKSIWYKYYRKASMPLKKIYFVWINRDKEAFSWFQSLLASLEETLAIEDIHNIALNSDMDVDPLTELQSRTHYGRPNWTNMMNAIKSNIPDLGMGQTEVGIFFCGPGALAKVIGKHALKVSDNRVKFVLRKEHF
ncbi:hypothetical protein BSLG_003995 [Batrachochytrium salamandrivorans]|nr:hypothetical protein BSLG_003995 [Batrachochytrium salamandrivorans]